jgi:hypothetical protein
MTSATPRDLAVILCDLILTLATLCDPQQSCDTCYAASPHVRHRGLNCAMCYATPPTVSTKTRISRDVTHYYIRYPEVQHQDGVTLAPPFLKFYLFYRLLLHLADVSQFYSAISISPFVFLLYFSRDVSKSGFHSHFAPSFKMSYLAQFLTNSPEI